MGRLSVWMRSGCARSRAVATGAAVVALLAACDGGLANSSRRERPSTSAPSSSPGNSLAIAAILVVAVRSPRQLLHIAAWSVPAAVLGFGLVSAPDALEQLLITGGF